MIAKGLYLTFIFLFINILISPVSRGQSIVIKNPDLRGQEVIFAYQYGNNVIEKSTAIPDENGFLYIYNDSLHSGIYYIIFEDSSMVELMYDRNYPGKITVKKDILSNSYSIEGPIVTIEFSNYLKDLTALNINEKGNNKNVFAIPDSTLLFYAKKVPGSLLEKYIRAQLKINVPEFTAPAEISNKDSIIWVYQMEYYRKHFLDNIDFSCPDLIYTPEFSELIDTYIDNKTKPAIIDYKQSLEIIGNKIEANAEFQKFTAEYLLSKFENKINTPLYEWSYIYVIENYYLKSGYSWISNDEITKYTKIYNRRKPALLGEKAPDINYGIIELNKLENDFILIYFFNYDCPICDKVTPEIRKLVSRYDYLDIATFTVCLGDDSTKWQNYISTKKIAAWNNVFDSKQSVKTALDYNINYIPSLFLLDKNKRIIDKNFTTAQLEKFLYKVATDNE